ncbi:MAG: transcriptional regulator NrdR [Desulfotomaculum sp.]|jgi:transcriptional repressor NrdR|nr:transcriptional regulator NrdR [Desulfotomaculum sp.]MCL0032758.1 transcriptional regulator NrdR [Peptococcaceae bacterium]MCL0052666.1 transcriptional regulator NrdR [Peptococcaceae bacterium]MCL0077509.1 transcriptional regulator NrdR [Peptococcaceae bacterium]MCL0100223.1 transcriptional regulator NrdR [Peptococcaceae bacterium]
MRCPFCDYENSRVLDSRPANEGRTIRRRRECEKCGRRFTTYERVEESPLVVVKKDGRREMFDRGKLLSGLVKACEKRPVPIEKLENLTYNIEKTLRNRMELEVNSREIGELVMDWLRQEDEVAYVRFASVYREFQDVHSFMKELKEFLNSKE